MLDRGGVDERVALEAEVDERVASEAKVEVEAVEAVEKEDPPPLERFLSIAKRSRFKVTGSLRRRINFGH